MPLSHVKMRHLNCFLKVALFGSVTKAAQNLNLTIPATSRTIKELEVTLGTKLFIRTKDGMVLAREGNALLHHARKGMAELELGLHTLMEAKEEANVTLNVGAPDHLLAAYLPEVISDFKRKQGAVAVRVFQAQDESLYDQVKQNNLSIVFSRFMGASNMIGLTYEELFDEPIVLAVRADHPLAGHPSRLLRQPGAR